jgi:hypothetical protein
MQLERRRWCRFWRDPPSPVAQLSPFADLIAFQGVLTEGRQSRLVRYLQRQELQQHHNVCHLCHRRQQAENR